MPVVVSPLALFHNFETIITWPHQVVAGQIRSTWLLKKTNIRQVDFSKGDDDESGLSPHD